MVKKSLLYFVVFDDFVLHKIWKSTSSSSCWVIYIPVQDKPCCLRNIHNMNHMFYSGDSNHHDSKDTSANCLCIVVSYTTRRVQFLQRLRFFRRLANFRSREWLKKFSATSRNRTHDLLHGIHASLPPAPREAPQLGIMVLIFEIGNIQLLSMIKRDGDLSRK